MSVKFVWEMIKHKLQKLGCFLAIVLFALVVSGVVKLILGWMHYDAASQQVLGKKVFDWVAAGILIALVSGGLIVIIRRIHLSMRSHVMPLRPEEPPLTSPTGEPAGRSAVLASRQQKDSKPCVPPPLPKRSSWRVKGCLVGLVVFVCLSLGGCFLLNHLAQEYDKRTKQSGEAEFIIADDLISSNKDQEGYGNTPEAKKFAEQFARLFRVSRQMLFTEGKARSVSMSQGYFLTYCQVRGDSLAVIVHVPDLRHFSNDAKITLSEQAWTIAVANARSIFPNARQLILGVRGSLDYDAIYEGDIPPEGDSLRGIRMRHKDPEKEVFWPYFAMDPVRADAVAPESK